MGEILGDFDWIVALVLGFVAAWVIQIYRHRIALLPSTEELEETEREQAAETEASARLKERAETLDRSLAKAQSELEELRSQNTGLHGKLAAAGERSESQEKRLEEQKAELEKVQKKLTAEFENLANRILDEKSKKFVVQNKESLDKLLNPFSERIKDFRERVDKVHEEGLKDRAALKEQLKHLHSLNREMTEEAQNLTTALKGQTKTQGNWGEMILERVLEKSGLVAGQEYELDCIIYASGFEVGTEYTRRAGFDLTGRDGQKLSERWAEGMKTMHGVHVHGFPNLFIVQPTQGANLISNVPHNLVESGRTIGKIIAHAQAHDCAEVEVTKQAEDAWIELLLSAPKRSLIGSPDCTPGYYNNEGQDPGPAGKLRTGYPAGALAYFRYLQKWRDSGTFDGLEFR